LPLTDKEARSTYNREYYAQRKQRHREYMRGFYAKRKQRLVELKRDRACERCGFADPCALDFHHREPAEKSFKISEYAWKVSDERLLAEIAKCDVLCANCHRVEHCKS
jgi:hypothetical protein